MNDTTAPLVRPEVATFVEDVRARLADLTDEEREELLGGLEADLSDLVADGAPLGDPRQYAAELRAAAGLPEPTRRLPRPTLPRRAHAERLLDGSRAWFLDLVRSRGWTREAWEVVSALRPAWWVARAWVAVTVVDVASGPWEPVSLVPSLGHPLTGWVCLVLAVLGSTLLGTGRLWPGSGPRRSVAARVVLVLLNAAAVVLPLAVFSISAPGYLTGTPYGDGYDDYSAGYRDAQREPGLRSNGRQVTNVFAYDAQGRPLDDVQLFDQQGRPLAVDPGGHCPALVLGDRAWNVYPLGVQDDRSAGCGTVEGEVAPSHPLATVPAVGYPEAEAVEAPDGGEGKPREKGQRDGRD